MDHAEPVKPRQGLLTSSTATVYLRLVNLCVDGFQARKFYLSAHYFWSRLAVPMKRLYTFMVLLGLAMGVMLAGCSQSETSTPPATNAPPASTNK